MRLRKLNRAIKGCDRVVHFAAESHVDRSITNSRAHLLKRTAQEQEISGSRCQKSNREICTCIHRRGLRVHWNQNRGGLFYRGDQLNPSSPYSATKAAG